MADRNQGKPVRDPRHDPMGRDELATKWRYRRVIRGTYPYSTGIVIFETASGEERTVSLSSWRKWAQRADVWERGENA